MALVCINVLFPLFSLEEEGCSGVVNRSPANPDSDSFPNTFLMKLLSLALPGKTSVGLTLHWTVCVNFYIEVFSKDHLDIYLFIFSYLFIF